MRRVCSSLNSPLFFANVLVPAAVCLSVFSLRCFCLFSSGHDSSQRYVPAETHHAQTFHKHWGSFFLFFPPFTFYGLDRVQVTRQTTWSRQQQVYPQTENSFKQREKCLFEYGFRGVGLIIGCVWMKKHRRIRFVLSAAAHRSQDVLLVQWIYVRDKQHSSWLLGKRDCYMALPSSLDG